MKRKKVIILSILVIVVSIISIGYSDSFSNLINIGQNDRVTAISFPQPGGAYPEIVEFTFGGMTYAQEKIKPDKKNQTDYVYSIANTNLKENLIPKLKKAFKMENSKEVQDNTIDTTKYENSDFTLDIFSNGTFNYIKKKKSDSENVIVSDEESKIIASEFLKKYDLLPNDFTTGSVAHHILTNVKDPSIQKILSKEVYFNRKINGISVLGLSRINVEIGSGGNIEGVYYLQREIEKNKKAVKIKPIDQAIEDMKNFKGTITVLDDVKKINVEKVELAYWEDSSPSSKQQTIQPIYRFTGNSLNEKVETKNFEAFISAIPDELTNPAEEPNLLPSDQKQVDNPKKTKIHSTVNK